MAPTLNPKKTLGSCDFLLSQIKFVEPEELVAFVLLQPHQQGCMVVVITPYLPHRAACTSQFSLPVTLSNSHPHPTLGFVYFHEVRPCITQSWG